MGGQCVSCGRETDLYLCWECCKNLKRRLDDAAWLARELTVTASRQARIASPADRVRGNIERPLPFHWAAADIAWALHNTLGTWARELCSSRGIDYVPLGYVPVSFVGPLPAGQRYAPAGADTTADIARWLSHHVMAIAASVTAGQCYDEISDAVAAALRRIDRPPPRLYIGPCGEAHGIGECDADLYVTMGAAEVHCAACGATHLVDKRRQQLRDQVRGILGTAAELAKLLPWVLDAPITRKRITYYAKLKMVRPRTVCGETMFQIGEVIDAHCRFEASPRRRSA
jgi:hypothetical protein